MTKYFILLIVILGSFALYASGVDHAMQRDPGGPVHTSQGNREKSGQEILDNLDEAEQAGGFICGDGKGTGRRQPACHDGRKGKKSQFPKVMIHAFPYKQTVTTLQRPTIRLSPDC